MPRIFLPAVTAKNNALLAGDTQVPSAAPFEIRHSDDDDDGSSTEEDESMSPDLLRPAHHKRAQPQQQQQQHPEDTGRPAVATPALLSTGNNKRARVQDAQRTDYYSGRRACTNTDNNEGQAAEPPQGDEDTFAVVFMTVALGITLAAPPSSDADGSLVVCDKDTNNTTTSASPTSRICVGDRLVAVGGTSAAGLSVDRVQRLIVRGSRPLEMTFRRPRSTPDGGATAAATKQRRRPVGGLEPPSRDCLLDTISNIATHEDRLLPGSQPQWPEHQQQEARTGVVAGVSGRGRSENGGGGDGGDGPSPPRTATSELSPSPSPPSPPLLLLSSLPPERPRVAGGDDGNGHPERRAPLHQPGESPPSAQDPPSPAPSSSSSSSLVTEAELQLLSPSAAGRETQVAIPSAANTTDVPSPSQPHRREKAKGEAATPVAVLGPPGGAGASAAKSLSASRVVAVAEPAASAQAPAHMAGGSGSGADIAKEPNPKRPKSSKNKKKGTRSGGRTPVTAVGAAVSPRQLLGDGTVGRNKDGLTGSSSSGGGRCGGVIGDGGGGSGSGCQATARASSATAGESTLVPTATEVARILAKLGARGVSELTLYKNLSFDELVKVCRYTGGIDLSKRLPKATMAERLNTLCGEKGALAHELRAAAGVEVRTEQGEGLAGVSRSAREAGRQNDEALSTPAQLVAALTPPPRRVSLPSDISAEPPSVRFAASPPPPRRPSNAHGGAHAAPQNLPSSSLVQTPLTTPMTTPQHQQQPPPPLSPRSWNSSGRASGNAGKAALSTSTSPTAAREERSRGGAAAPVEDDQHCWEDWDFLDNARGRGRRGVAPRRKKGDHGEGGGNDDDEDGGDDEEAAWWSQEPDHRDWSPCSSPIAAAAGAAATVTPVAPYSRSFPASHFTRPAGERGWDSEGDQEDESRRRNPLLPPPTLSSLFPSAGQQEQQSVRSGRSFGNGLGFTALPKWILRSVRTIGTQTAPRRVR
eukprot:g9214.t1